MLAMLQVIGYDAPSSGRDVALRMSGSERCSDAIVPWHVIQYDPLQVRQMNTIVSAACVGLCLGAVELVCNGRVGASSAGRTVRA